MGEIRRRLRWVYLAKRDKSLSPKTQKSDNDNAIRKKINEDTTSRARERYCKVLVHVFGQHSTSSVMKSHP